jgi:hypothetical protein
MSQKAIWISHIWESPALQSEARIESDVIDTMVFGTFDALNLLDPEVKDSFSPETDTRVYIITP